MLMVRSLYHPRRAGSRSNVLLYLPRGPLLGNSQHEAAIIATLRSQLDCFIVKVDYRLSSRHRYPGPVHDVLAGYDWVLRNLASRGAPDRPNGGTRIAVFGELIGGGLATSLALTECRVGELGICAAAVNNPIVDWMSLNASPDPKAASQTGTPDHTTDVINMRSQVLAKAAADLDPFASPILFFRSSGAEVPPPPSDDATMDDMQRLTLIEREQFEKEQAAKKQAENARLSSCQTSEPATSESGLKTYTKKSRNFPGRRAGLHLPQFHVSTGAASPFLQQAQELSTLLRQSVVRQARYAVQGRDFGRKDPLDDEDNATDREEVQTLRELRRDAETKVLLCRHERLALWGDPATDPQSLLETCVWLRSRLG